MRSFLQLARSGWVGTKSVGRVPGEGAVLRPIELGEPPFKFLEMVVDRGNVTAVPVNVEPPLALSSAGPKASSNAAAKSTAKVNAAGGILRLLTIMNVVLLLLMALGVAAKWQAGPPKGDSVIDFTTYYSGGRMAGVDRGAHLYDLVAQAKDQTALAGIPFNPAAKKLQVVGFVNPPTSALLLRPLSLLPLTSAYRMWMLLELILLVAAGWLILRVAGANRTGAFRHVPFDFVFPSLALAAAFPVGAALLQGSLTPVVVLGFALFAKGVIVSPDSGQGLRSRGVRVGALGVGGEQVGEGTRGTQGANNVRTADAATRQGSVVTSMANGVEALPVSGARTGGREITSLKGDVTGERFSEFFTATGLLLIGMKPQYVLLPLAVLLGLRRFRALGFTAVGQAILMALSMLIVRPSAWIDYLKLLGTYNREIDTYGSSTSSMINVRGILARFLGSSNASIINMISSAVLGAAILGITYLAHRSFRANSAEDRIRLLIAMLLAGLIASPHAHSHDWTLALVALALAWFLPKMTAAKRCLLALVPIASFVTMSGVGSVLGKTPILMAAIALFAAIRSRPAKTLP
jgi:Glycosyltransferase family 87